MIRVSINNILAAQVGSADGLTDSELHRTLKAHEPICKEIRSEKDSGRLGFAKLPYNETDSEKCRAFGARMDRIENFVHVGIGGSVLGAQAIVRALTHPYHNDIRKPKMYFIDNIDPGQIAGLLEFLNLKRSMVYVVTKSGETTETVATMLILIDAMRKVLGPKLRDHLVVATDPLKGYLRGFAREEKLGSFEIPPDVGGRFSALTPVGLVPAAVVGINPGQLLEGAKIMDRLCSNLAPRENPAALLAAVAFALYRQKGKRLFAIMPYSNALESFADWFVQLWAESLGKRLSLDGRVVNEGHTPIRSVGARDQHSMIQLFNEGPNDKFISIVDVEKHARDAVVPAGIPHWEFLGKKKVSDILRAERAGTESALAKNKRPNATLALPELSPQSIGALLYLFEMAVVHFAKLLQVNPFDQPGVEAGKKAAFALLGRDGKLVKKK